MRRTVFNEDHEAFRETIRAFIEAEVVPVYDEWFAAGQAPRDFYYKLGELGVFGIEVPEEFGGAGLDSLQVRGRALRGDRARAASTSAAPACTSLLGLPYLKMLATDEQKKRWLPKFVSGEEMWAIAMTEPGTGSDLAGMKTTAKLSEDGTHYVLNGAKTFITGGVHADRVIVCARTSAPTRRGPPLRHLPLRRGHQVRGLLDRPQAGQARPAAPPTPPSWRSSTSRSRSRTCSARRTRASTTSATTSPPERWGIAFGAYAQAKAAVRFAQEYVAGAHRLRQAGRLVPEHQVRAGRLPGRGGRGRGRRRPRPGGPRRRRADRRRGRVARSCSAPRSRTA